MPFTLCDVFPWLNDQVNSFLSVNSRMQNVPLAPLACHLPRIFWSVSKWSARIDDAAWAAVMGLQSLRPIRRQLAVSIQLRQSLRAAG